MQSPPLQPSGSEIKAAEVVAKELLRGIEGAANQQPTNYLVIVAVIATLVALCVVVGFFLRYLKDLDLKQDARESERQRHIEKIAESAAINSAASQKECHTHSLQMMQGRNEQTANIRDIAVELAHACEGVKQTSTTVGEIAKTAAQVVNNAMQKLESSERRADA
jgi:uncharacterized protein YybS (DUF2232 family)